MLRRIGAAHPRLLDAVVAAVSLLVGWVQTDAVGLVGPFWAVAGGPWAVVNVVTAASLLLRRTRPVVPLVVAAVGGLLVLVDDRGPLTAPLVVTVYSFAVHRSTRAGLAAAAVLIAEALVLASIPAAAPGGAPSFTVLCLLVALLLGVGVGERRRYLDAVLDRAASLAMERDQRAQLAVAAERARIARELHDVVAHGLSVIVRLSDGADAVARTDPGRSQEVVQQIGRVGRDSLRDMRRLLGVLGEEDAGAGAGLELAPQPSLADLDALVATFRSAGLPVVVERSGGVQPDPTVQLVVYRAVQEGLTNALRYARAPGRVVVRLRFAEVVEVEVVDDGAGTGREASVGSGRGLLGLRERARLYGGEVLAGPRADLGGRGWRLRVRLAPVPEETGAPG